MFDSPDNTLTKVITNIFDTSKLIMAPLQRRSNNCGIIFAIAVCMAILLEENEDVMRRHLCKYFDKKTMTKFP